MTRGEAVRILGSNRAKWELQMMRTALSLLPQCNTAEEAERLEAVKVALRNWPAFTKACAAKRDSRKLWQGWIAT